MFNVDGCSRALAKIAAQMANVKLPPNGSLSIGSITLEKVDTDKPLAHGRMTFHFRADGSIDDVNRPIGAKVAR